MTQEERQAYALVFTKSLLKALRERDPYTYGHCARVAHNAKLLAKAAGLSSHQQSVVELSSLFHDLGKMGIPDSVLLKPGRLTEEEEAIMRSHPIKSAEIIRPLQTIKIFKETLPGIENHHERIDGLGYPFGKAGDEIPLSARLILIADTYDAMTTTRPYRKGLPPEIAYKELVTFAGRQFDKDLVKIFLQAHPTWDEYDEEITEEHIASEIKKSA